MMWKIVLPFLAALLAVGFCGLPGGLFDISVHDREFQEALNFAVDDFNSHSDSDYLYKVQLVVTAQAQVVAGMNYVTTVLLTKTICRKDHVHDNCPFNSNPRRAEFYSCTFEVYSPLFNPKSLSRKECRRLR